jgi:hypothetical protein
MELMGIENMDKAVYGLVDSGIFGARVVAGVVTGIRYTEERPLYEVSFGKNSWWTPDITDKVEEIWRR